MNLDNISPILIPLQVIFAAVQDDPIAKWITFGLSIACAIIELAYRLWKWRKNAKADGVITDKEKEEAIEIIHDGVEDIKDITEKGTKNGKTEDSTKDSK